MVLQVRPDAGKVDADIDAGLVEQPLGADAAPLEDLGAVQSAGGDDDLAVRLDGDALGVLDAALAHDDAGGVLVVVEGHLVDAPAGEEVEAGAVLGGVPVAVDGVGAGGWGVVEGGGVPDDTVRIALWGGKDIPC